MALSKSVVNQFAKLTNVKNEERTSVVKGIYKKIDGVEYVKLDGSNILTPVEKTVNANDEDRVTVEIKNHIATVIRNITNPSAGSTDLTDLKNKVDEQGNTITQQGNSITQQGNSITQINNNITSMNNTITQQGNVINQQNDKIVSLNNTVIAQGNTIEATNNTVKAQGNKIESMNDTIKTQGNNITAIDNTVKAQGNRIEANENNIKAHGNSIEANSNLIKAHETRIESNETSISTNTTNINTNATNIKTNKSNITILNSGFVIKDGVLTGLSKIIIDNLKTENLDASYANIDFSNIGTAAVEKLFTDSGIIKDLVVSEGHITGELVGVTIKGDLIEAGTVKADKLVVKGQNGIYYKLNLDGETVEAQQTNENSLNGSVITAKSITASKVQVDDLVAFDATIGGFNITDSAIHSVEKSSINSNIKGLYMDKTGQLYLGDDKAHIRYYKDANGVYKLDISADAIKFSTSDESINDTIERVDNDMSTLIDESTKQKNELGKLNKNIQSNTTLIEQKSNEINNNVVEITGQLNKDINDLENDLNKTNDNLISQIVENKTLIKQLSTSIISTIKTTGGSNLLRNSVGYKGKSFWETTGNISTYYDDNMSVSGSVFILNGVSSLKQTYNTIIGSTYNISCKIKHKSVGSLNKVKITLYGQGNDSIPVVDTDAEMLDWTEFTLQIPYTATVTNPYIKIECLGDDILEVTDLIIANGEAGIWSPYSDEVYGKEHLLDKNGLTLKNINTSNFTEITSTDIQLQNGDNIVAELSKERVYSDTGVYNNSITVGKLQTIKLDEYNIIEYIGGE